MAEITGDYIGTTFDDFLVLPNVMENAALTPETVDISADLCGIDMIPFFTAAMRSVTGKDLALAAGKSRMMSVAPRGLTAEKEAEIIQYVKDHEVRPGEIERQRMPITVFDYETLGLALERQREHGHSNIPVVARNMNFVGMFTYISSVHDKMDRDTPLTEAMNPFKDSNGRVQMDVCREDMPEDEIKYMLTEKGYRFVPVLDSVGRLSSLVFMQKDEAYKVGGAVDTHVEWMQRVHMLVDAGADMIFIDTSDAYKSFSGDVVTKYKKEFPDGPPICAGNIVTPQAFDYFHDLGVDAVKVGMGPGSICSTNEVLGIGAPPMHALIEIARRRNDRASSGRYVPVIVDGGVTNTGDVTVAMTHADGVMGGKIFGGFEESAGLKIRDGSRIIGIRIFGEASQEAYETTGDMNRYASPLDPGAITSFQGVSGLIPYRGRFKPGVEIYKRTLKEALYHAGCDNLKSYRDNAVLVRLSARAKEIAKPHDIQVVRD